MPLVLVDKRLAAIETKLDLLLARGAASTILESFKRHGQGPFVAWVYVAPRRHQRESGWMVARPRTFQNQRRVAPSPNTRTGPMVTTTASQRDSMADTSLVARPPFGVGCGTPAYPAPLRRSMRL